MSLSKFDVRCVATCFAKAYLIFTGICEHGKFVRKTSTNGSRICLNLFELQATTPENICIGLSHFCVSFLSVSLIGVKAVSIFHYEFPASHNSKARSNLIAKLCLYLIKNRGELPVRFDFFSNYICDYFFVCRPIAKFPVVSILDSK